MMASRVLVFCLFALIAAALTSCNRTPPEPIRPEPDARYTVRGIIEQLPSKDNRLSEFVVHHEPIDDFKAFNGTVGMDSMSMPFPVARTLSLDGLAVGDRVSVEFVVWSTPGQRGFEARSVTRLPPDTELRFGPAKPVAPATTSATVKNPAPAK